MTDIGEHTQHTVVSLTSNIYMENWSINIPDKVQLHMYRNYMQCTCTYTVINPILTLV